MHPKRVLIINVRSLLMENLSGLLNSSGNGKFDVVSTLADNLTDLIRETMELKPDIIVIDEATSVVNPANLIVSLLNIQAIRLIALNSRTDKMDIYDKSESIIKHPSQFIEALKIE